MILAATLVFLFGLIVISAVERYARIVTIVLSVIAIGLFFEFAAMAGANIPTEAPHWDPLLDMIGD
jgi:purine-cytosine permease-like protein